jgi:hypothetical protein
MSRAGGLACTPLSAPSRQADLSLATAIHSLNCPFSPSKPSFLRVPMYACRIVCWGLPTGRGIGHHASSLSLVYLDAFIMPSLQSHRHLCMSIIDSIVDEFAAVLLTRSFLIRFSATSHKVQRNSHKWFSSQVEVVLVDLKMPLSLFYAPFVLSEPSRSSTCNTKRFITVSLAFQVSEMHLLIINLHANSRALCLTSRL